jgi:hypothetical protein
MTLTNQMVCCSDTPLSYSQLHLEVPETPSFRVLSEYSAFSHPSSPSILQQPILPMDQSTPPVPSTSSPHVSCSYYPSRQEVGPRYKRRSLFISKRSRRERGGQRGNAQYTGMLERQDTLAERAFRLSLFSDTVPTRLDGALGQELRS